MDDMIYKSAEELAQAIRDGDLTSEVVVETHLERIAAVNPQLNTVVQLRAEAALAEARFADQADDKRAPLHGVPVTIKDNILVKDMPITFGTTGLKAHIAPADGICAKRMRDAGAIIIGITNMPEMGLAVETDNLVYGRTNNPYGLAHTSGGSSGGEGAIIAAGGSPLGIGNDIGGSIRYPAHCNGIVGIKPTSGRVPRTRLEGAGGLSAVMSQNGPLARTVADLTLALKIIAGPDDRDASVYPVPLGDPSEVDVSRLRVAYYADNGFATPTPETVIAIEVAAKALNDVVAEMTQVLPPLPENLLDLYFRLLGADGGLALKAYLARLGTTEYSPLLAHALSIFEDYAVSAPELLGAVFQWNTFKNQALAFMNRYDVIICPVSAMPAPEHGATFDEANRASLTYAATYNMLGYPAVVIRAGTSPEGLPIGVQIVAAPWREDVALSVAGQLEASLGTFPRPSLA